MKARSLHLIMSILSKKGFKQSNIKWYVWRKDNYSAHIGGPNESEMYVVIYNNKKNESASN